MNKKLIYLGFAILITLNAVLLFSGTTSAPKKIAYVRTQHLVDNYLGMKEARSKYQNMKTSWQSSLDTLKLDYQKGLTQYNSTSHEFTEIDRRQKEAVLQKQYENISGYANMLDEKAAEQDERLTSGVLAQVDSFLNEYGDNNGYDLIIGVTNAGNVLYGNDGIDITDQILDKLNNDYKNGTVASK